MSMVDAPAAGHPTPAGHPEPGEPSAPGGRGDPFGEDPFGPPGPARPDDPRTGPRLFIPYHPGDNGDRTQPFPPWVVSYLCDGLAIFRPDGSPHLAGRLPRDQTSTVVVRVANGRPVSTWAQVSLYWTDPSAGFAPPHLRRLPEIGNAVTVKAPGGYTVSAPPITLRPGASTPEHFCLVAVVSAIDDPASGSWDPLADRHYAQHNLDLVEVDPGGLGSFPFYAVNPFIDSEAIVSVRLRPATSEQTQRLARTYGAHARVLPAARLRLIHAAGREQQLVDHELRIELGAGQRQLCQGLVAAGELADGDVALVEVQTTAVPVGRTGVIGQDARGSFGVALFAGRWPAR